MFTLDAAWDWLSEDACRVLSGAFSTGTPRGSYDEGSVEGFTDVAHPDDVPDDVRVVQLWITHVDGSPVSPRVHTSLLVAPWMKASDELSEARRCAAELKEAVAAERARRKLAAAAPTTVHEVTT